VRKSFVVLISVLLLSMASWANVVNVDCSGNTPWMPSTIAQGLDWLGTWDSSNTLIVSGTCNENVTIDNYRNLTIMTLPGETATINATDASQPTLHLIACRGVAIFSLQVNGGDQGILLNTSSQADIINTTVNGAGTIGIHAQMGSTLTLNNVTVQQTGGDGIRIDGGSNATFGFVTPDTAVRSINNGGFGLSVDGASVQTNNGFIVSGNQGGAVLANGARMLFNGSSDNPNMFSDNAAGLTIRGGSATFQGKNTIANNGGFGVLTIGSTVNFAGGNGTTIEGHSSYGMFVDRASNVTLAGKQLIQNNGSAIADPLSSSGIFVNMGGVLLVTSPNVSITDNIGFGIGADQMGIVTMDGLTIARNSREGVHLGHLSNGFIGPSVNFGTNGVASITCDKTSYAFVDEQKNYTGTNCKNIEKK
jgi:Right handed beta helix region